MSHVGMCPHFVHQYGGFKLQGRTAAEAMRIVEDGIAIEQAGAVGFEIEAVPAPVAKAVDDAVTVEALRRHAAEVRDGKFPDADHSYDMKPEERQELARLISQRR